MSKQEAIEEIKDLYSFVMEDGPFEVDLINKRHVIDIISQIDEPQKVVIPKFVAEWIDELKKSHSNLAWVWKVYPNEPKVKNWLESNTEKFMRAWLDGYEIEQEKEKLYIVEIPNPHTYIDNHSRLARNYKGKVVLEVQDWLNVAESYKLTESEIKQDFEWAWDAGFAKEVEK